MTIMHVTERRMKGDALLYMTPTGAKGSCRALPIKFDRMVITLVLALRSLSYWRSTCTKSEISKDLRVCGRSPQDPFDRKASLSFLASTTASCRMYAQFLASTTAACRMLLTVQWITSLLLQRVLQFLTLYIPRLVQQCSDWYKNVPQKLCSLQYNIPARWLRQQIALVCHTTTKKVVIMEAQSSHARVVNRATSRAADLQCSAAPLAQVGGHGVGCISC